MNTKVLFPLLLIILLSVVACAPAATPAPGNAPIPNPATTAPPDTPAEAQPDSTATPAAPVEAQPTTTTAPSPVSLGAGTLTALAALPENAIQPEVGYQERWFTYLLERVPTEPTGPGALPASLYVLDTTDGTSWEVTNGCTTFVCEFTWTSDGQLLWLEEGNVYMAAANGENKRDLDAPMGMTEIFGISSANVAVLRGGDGSDLWRLYLPDGTFDAVPDAQPNSQPVQTFVTQNDLLYFTADGTMAGLSYDASLNRGDSNIQIIALPLEAGATPMLLAAPTGLQAQGGDGPAPAPPALLNGTPYWLPSYIVWREQGGATVPMAVVINAETGDVESLDGLMGLTDQGLRSLYTVLSPDRQWVAAYVEPIPVNNVAPNNVNQRFYVANVADLRSGMMMDGSIEGWQTNLSAIIIKEYTSGNNTLVWVSLTDGTRQELFTGIPDYTFGYVLSTPQALFVHPSRAATTVGVFTPDGVQAATVDVPLRLVYFAGGGSDQFVEPVGAVESRAYLYGGDPTEGGEQGYLWRWEAAE